MCGPCDDGLQMCSGSEWGTCSGGTARVTYHRDMDGDGFGNPATSMPSCTPLPGWVTDGRDCNDDCVSCSPSGTEICDGLDNDCDGAADEGAGTIWYQDNDGDGFGDGAAMMVACSRPGVAWTSMAGDCDDDCALCYPGYPQELCLDGHDNNCNGVMDEPGCPCDLHALSTGTYLWCATPQSWSNGRTLCQSLGGDLVSLETSAETNAVWGAFRAIFWAGGTDSGAEGVWVWVSGAPVCAPCSCLTCGWRAGEPNGFDAYDCTRVGSGGTATWGDQSCDLAAPIVCEMP